MVTAVTSFGRSGLYDWLIQRVGAVVLTAYTIFLVVYIAMNPEMDYAQWSALYSQLWMRIFSLLALISFITHAWIGLWSVLTDYLTNRLLGAKATVLRLLAQIVLGVAAVTYLVWGVEILWGF
ncbi:MAG: succinate dehydrogenase, hydrophobic membrane anchor protein [Cellvibrio sp.]|jgi:succinate dehydrogenase / fumarate reductase membrane anchor subunit